MEADSNSWPTDGEYYFKDGGQELRARVRNTKSQLRITLLDEPPMYADARLEQHMYSKPDKTLVYKKPKLMPNGQWKHQTLHAIQVWDESSFTLYAGREGIPTVLHKQRK